MKNIILVENYHIGIKKAYSNLKKALSKYGISYFKAYKKIRNKGVYRSDNDYVITKLKVE